jgi:hypothetical protein
VRCPRARRKEFSKIVRANRGARAGAIFLRAAITVPLIAYFASVSDYQCDR